MDISGNKAVLHTPVLNASPKYKYFRFRAQPEDDRTVIQSDNTNNIFHDVVSKADNSGFRRTKKTGTDIFTPDGVYIGRLDSSLPLQIIFVDMENLYDVNPELRNIGKNDPELSSMAIRTFDIINRNNFTASERNAYSKYFRTKASAIISNTSIDFLKSIALESSKIGKYGTELGFYGSVSTSKEIVFKKFLSNSEYIKKFQKRTRNNSVDSRTTAGKDLIQFYVDQGGSLLNIFAFGHTHSAEYFVAEFPNTIAYNKLANINRIELYGAPSGRPYSSSNLTNIKDYDTVLFKRKIALFIASPDGFTIFSSDHLVHYIYPYFLFN